MKILVIDDSQSIRSLLEHILQEEGYEELFFAKSAKEGFALLESEKIDLILMDIIMPDIDGLEACVYIYDKLGLNHIPVIMVTGKTDTDSLKKAFEAGAIDYIKKPFTRIELLARINSAIRLIKKELKLKETVNLLEKANKELEKMVSIDGLTEIANRKFFDDTLAKEWDRAKRKNSPLSLLMIDIDNFKDYNDTYGHQGGDECLKKLANLFDELAFRSGDLAARYGGEEFVIILADTDLAGAKEVGERVRSQVEKLEIEHKASKVSDYVTISLGAAVARPEVKDDEKALIEAADKALYRAKEGGRNQLKDALEVIK